MDTPPPDKLDLLARCWWGDGGRFRGMLGGMVGWMAVRMTRGRSAGCQLSQAPDPYDMH